MRSVLAYERRLQDIERQLQNKFRVCKVKEMKFENRRWFVRVEDGQGDRTFRTDWIPWRSFSHGTISFSVPPRVNQTVAINSPNGWGEMAYCEPYHYDPDHPSPHDKENEVFMKIQAADQGDGQGGQQGEASQAASASGGPSDPISEPTGQGYMSVHATEKLCRVMKGQAMFELTEDTIKIIAPNIILGANAIALNGVGGDSRLKIRTHGPVDVAAVAGDRGLLTLASNRMIIRTDDLILTGLGNYPMPGSRGEAP